MTWTKLPPYQGRTYRGCNHAPPVEEIAPLDMLIAVGFGAALVTKDGAVVYEERPGAATWEDYPTLRQFETQAQADPDHDWRVTLEGALSGSVYQRHGADRWVLIESNQGFA